MAEEHQVDTPTSEALKEVFAWFGACMYHGQVLEVGLVSLLTALETAKSKAPTRATFDALQAKYEQKTLGALIGKLSSHAILSSNLAEALKHATTKRNHLAHHYFREHVLELQTNSGCRRLVEELQTLCQDFIAIANKDEELQMRVLAEMGIEPREFAKIKRSEEQRLRAAANHLARPD